MGTLLMLVVVLAGSLKAELDSLIQAERSFAALSAAQGIRAAFLSNLAEDSIIFRPTAVRGRQWFERNPGSPAQLSWAPEFADIAAAGDLGYTTGPWELRPATGQTGAPAFGHFVTLWRKQADGKWKAALDIGISHSLVPRPTAVQSPKIGIDLQNEKVSKEIEAARESIAQQERAFRAAPDWVARHLAADARLYREGNLPYIGDTAARQTLAGIKGDVTWKLAEVHMSKSADLGYAYGTAEFKPADASKPVEKSNFLRIWKKDGSRWKVVLDLLD